MLTDHKSSFMLTSVIITSSLFLIVVMPASLLKVEAIAAPLHASGDFLWAGSMGGVFDDWGNSIAIDSRGDVFTTGQFSGTMDADPGPGTFKLTSVGGGNSFVSKLNGSGDFLWARNIGRNYGSSITIDLGGNIYITGSFQGTVDFDPGPGIFNLTSIGNSLSPDVFISKFNSSGYFLWAKSLGGEGTDSADGIVVDKSGNVYTTGFFEGCPDFDPGPGTYNLTCAEDRDIFISKLNSSGNFVWAKSMDGTWEDTAAGIALDSNSNVYTTGLYAATADFDPSLGIHNLTSNGNDDLFISKLDSSGSFVWAKSIGGTDADRGYSTAVDSHGSVYTTGYFTSTADFDPGVGTSNLISAGSVDAFVIKLDGDNTSIFADVAPTYWAWNFIERLYSAGITGGCGTSPLQYCPETTVTRSQMAVFLLRGIHGSVYSPPAMGSSTDFGDVPIDYWSAPWIKQLAVEGITGGCGNGNYCPEYPVTRDQMAVFLLRSKYGSLYSPPAVGISTGFGDVPVNYWSAVWIKQLAAEGITGGCGSGNYCPEYPVTRDQMAVFLLRSKYGSSYSPPAVGTSTGFGDVPVDYWAAPWIKQLVTEGITAGCGSGNYCPEFPVSRAQMAVFLVRTFNLP